jgi:DNA replication protein DnaC
MDSLEQKLTILKLGRIRQVYNDWIARAAELGLGYGEFLEELLSEELVTRQENQLRKRVRNATFPFEATLEQFDFSRHPELKRSVMLRFFDSSFVEKTANLLLIGASGLGKTHLSVAVGLKMVQLGYSVKFITAQQFANRMLAAPSRSEAERVLEPLVKSQVLILDELGYLPLDERVGPALYELISRRYGRGATVITSNKSLTNWGELIVGGDGALMVAIIDRLLHHGEAFYLKGSSYRTLGKENYGAGPNRNVGPSGTTPGSGSGNNGGGSTPTEDKPKT